VRAVRPLARPLPRSMSTSGSARPLSQAAADGLHALGAVGRAGDGPLQSLGVKGVAIGTDVNHLELGVEFSKGAKLYAACRRSGITLQSSVLVRACRANVAQRT
jgi:hypothetical protein